MQKRTWRSEPSYMTEHEMAEHLRRRGVRVILDLGFTKGLAAEKVAELHDYAFEYQAKYSDVVIGHWLNIDPNLRASAVSEMARCLENDCFVGLSISGASGGVPATDPVWGPLLDLCEAKDCPVLVLVGHNGGGAGLPGGGGMLLDNCHPRYVDALAAQRPALRIVAGRPAWPWQDEMISVMLHKPNVWNELHGWSPRYLTEGLKHEIPRRLRGRIMFGADFPLFTYERLVADWEGLNLDTEVMREVFEDNALSFFESGRQFTMSASVGRDDAAQ